MTTSSLHRLKEEQQQNHRQVQVVDNLEVLYLQVESRSGTSTRSTNGISTIYGNKPKVSYSLLSRDITLRGSFTESNELEQP